MRQALILTALAVLALGPIAVAQQAAAHSGPNNAPIQSTSVPVSSPEPITMIALAGGAAAAGGLAHRRRKRK